MKSKFIDYYIEIAEVTAKLSYATRLQVGAVIVKGHKILATGYNGMPSGWDNTCEYVADVHPGDPRYDYNNFSKELKTKEEVLHAEMNCLMKVAGSTESSEGSTMFCTHAPCLQCAKMIYQSGIQTLYYKNTYRDQAGLDFLEKSKVNVIRYNN
jgi:dCMP deaminase